jgi:hypothetical protein
MAGREVTEDDLKRIQDEIASAGGESEAEPPEIGNWEALTSHAASAIPLGNLAVNSALTLLSRDKGVRARITPQAKLELKRRGEDPPVEAADPSLLDVYRAIRDERRERQEAGSQQHPKWSRAGTAFGIASTIFAPLPKVTVAAKVAPGAEVATRGAQALARLQSGAATGAAYGALGGATDGDADLTQGEVGKTAAQALGGGVVGAGVGLAGAGIAEGISRAAPLLRRFGIDMARRTINNRADLATRTKHPLSNEAAEEALRRDMFAPYGILPIPPTTPEVYSRLETAAEHEGARLGDVIDQLEAHGVQGPDARNIVSQLTRRGDAENATELYDQSPSAVYSTIADNLSQRIPEGERTIGLRAAELMKRKIGRDARFDLIANKPTHESLQEAYHMLRQGTEDAIASAGAVADEGSPVQQLAASFGPQKQTVGRLIEARDAAERGAASALGGQKIGLKDVILGSTMGNPVHAAMAAFASAGVRNRAPAFMARESYALSRALGGEGAAASLGRVGDWAATQGPESAQDWADETFDDPNSSRFQRLLAQLLRRRP